MHFGLLHVNKVLSFEQISNYVWEGDIATTDSIRTLVMRLRKKIPQNSLETIVDFIVQLSKPVKNEKDDYESIKPVKDEKDDYESIKPIKSMDIDDYESIKPNEKEDLSLSEDTDSDDGLTPLRRVLKIKV